jgi:hypothetical protein
VPNIDVLAELLVRPARGLLYTQPWILFLIPAFLFSIFEKPKAGLSVTNMAFYRKTAAAFCGISLVALLVMNMSYGGWHGGGAGGPRYISGIFLCFALWIALELDRFHLWVRWFFYGLLGISLLFRGLVYGSTILAPVQPLWEWYIQELSRPSKTPLLRFGIYLILFAATAFWQKKLLAKWKAS